MEHVLTREQVKDFVTAAGFSLAAAATLPLLGILVFTLRPVVIGVAVAAFLIGCLLCAFSGRFRKWLAAAIEPEIRYRGLRLARDIVLHPGHSWARMYSTVVVGADDLVQAALGPVEGVEAPPRGRRVQRGDRLFRLWRADRSLDVRAPVSGTVLESNEALQLHPELINQEPFGRGWVVRLRGDDLRTDGRLLLRGRRARAWFRREVDRVLDGFSRKPNSPRSNPGGEDAIGHLYRRIDDSAWGRLRAAVSAPQNPDPPPAP
ncbi:MAG: glycine cleavage system protein H [Phycisphaerales bacterium]|nr:MAG: glycine cleavage system protein H [Phycisphaerales bacterium]